MHSCVLELVCFTRIKLSCSFCFHLSISYILSAIILNNFHHRKIVSDLCMQCSIIVIFNSLQTSAEALTSEFKAVEQLHRYILYYK